MDTGTVLEIIKMIHTKRKLYKETLKTIPQYNQDEVQYWHGMLDGLQDLKQHLQSLIEAQLNAAENSTGE